MTPARLPLFSTLAKAFYRLKDQVCPIIDMKLSLHPSRVKMECIGAFLLSKVGMNIKRLYPHSDNSNPE